MKRFHRHCGALWTTVQRVRRTEDGSPAVELALVLPVLLLILFGILQFGLFFYLQNNMANAAREAARKLAVGEVTVSGDASCPGTANSAEEVACSYLGGWGGMTFTLLACDPDNVNATFCPGATDVTVRITVLRKDIAIYEWGGLFSGGKIAASATMRKE